MVQSACQYFAPSCPVTNPIGCGFYYPSFYPAGDQPRSVALGYMDGDSDLDVVVTNALDDTFSVLLGNGDGTFAASTDFTAGQNPGAVSIVDLDGDGISDVLIALRDEDAVAIFIANGTSSWSGSFQPRQLVYVSSDPYDMIVGDFDSDNVADFATTSNEYMGRRRSPFASGTARTARGTARS